MVQRQTDIQNLCRRGMCCRSRFAYARLVQQWFLGSRNTSLHHIRLPTQRYCRNSLQLQPRRYGRRRRLCLGLACIARFDSPTRSSAECVLFSLRLGRVVASLRRSRAYQLPLEPITSS